MFEFNYINAIFYYYYYFLFVLEYLVFCTRGYSVKDRNIGEKVRVKMHYMLLEFSLSYTCYHNAVFCSVTRMLTTSLFSNLNNFVWIWRSNIHIGICLKQWRKLLPNILQEKLLFYIYLWETDIVMNQLFRLPHGAVYVGKPDV